MYDPIHRCDEKSNYYHSAVSKAKGKEALREMLPLLETYLNNPTRYCWDRLVAFYGFNIDSLVAVDLPIDSKWRDYLSMVSSTKYEKDQGMILLNLTMLKEAILNVLNPERNR